MKLKRTFALLLALVLTLGLFAGCGKDKDPEEQNDDKTNTPSSSEETVIPQAKFVMKCFLQIVVLKHSGKGTTELLLIRKFVPYGILGLMELGRRDHLHCRSDLQRALDRVYSGLYFL